jgi:glutathione S-transferase
MTLHLVSHTLCPYVQRAVISLTEKGVSFDRTYIDLANKPDWFLAISPLGKTPVLTDGDAPIFESAVILEYLEETQSSPLHPSAPLDRARHRGWIEYSSSVLNDIGGLYNAPDAAAFAGKVATLRSKFERLETELGDGPYFSGEGFSLVDTAFGPVFRYFDVFDEIADFGILSGLPKVGAWREALNSRPSVAQAVSPDYNAQLRAFLLARNSQITALLKGAVQLA